MDLNGQFAGGRNDQCTWIMIDFQVFSGFEQMLENSQQKCCCFAGTGLCLASYIMSRQNYRKALCLNRGTAAKTGFIQGFYQWRFELELPEIYINSIRGCH